MTVLLQPEKYQSDRLTFERQQFEETLGKKYNFKPNDNYFVVWRDTGNYINAEIQTVWLGWKLAKGL